MDINTLNWLAILAAALSNFLIGGLWYSPAMFGKIWIKENKFTEEFLLQGKISRIYGFAFLWSLVISFNLAMFLNHDNTTIAWGATAGFLAGFGWVAMAIFIIGLFERKSIKYMLINAGYMIISFTVMGTIIGAWR